MDNPDFSTERDRLNALTDKIGEVQAKDAAENSETAENTTNARNMSTGARAGAELISTMLAGGLIGWCLDSFFETSPIFLIIFFLTGICVGFYEVYRITK